MAVEAGWLWRLRRTTVADLRLIGEAQAALLGCQLAKWRRPVGRFVTGAPRPAPAGDARDLRAAALVGWAVTRAARYGVFRPRCLVRSLAVQRMLRRRGIHSSELRIGVRMEGGALLAHAWVELDGVVIGDSLQHVRAFSPAPDLRLVEL